MTRPLYQFEQPDHHLVALVDAYLAGSASPDELAELNTAIESDEAAAAYVTTALDVHATLGWSRRGPVALPWADEQSDEPAAAQESYPIYRKGYEPKPTRIHPAYFAVAGIAAALLAACGLAVYLLTTTVDPKPAPVDPNQPGPSVATLIENTGNLVTPHGYPAEGDDYSAGEYTLSSGKAEFMLTNSVNVKLRGDTRMHMRNDMNVALARGSAEFVVPKDATGFTVHLPDGSKVIDHGTAFTVSVDDANRFDVRVTEGRVEWASASPNADPVRLVAGQYARSVDGNVAVTNSSPIANWKNFDGTGTHAHLNTDSPTFAEGRGDIAGRFGTTGSLESVTLAVGETLTVTGSMTFTRGNNGPTIRFGVFNDGGQFPATASNWTAGYLHKTSTPEEGLPGLYQARTNGFFLSTNKNAKRVISKFDTTTGSWDTDSTTPFDFSFSITRDSVTTLSLVSTISGGDGNRVETLAGTLTPPNADCFTYTTFGMLAADATGIERIEFSNVRYVVTPSQHMSPSRDEAEPRPTEGPTDE